MNDQWVWLWSADWDDFLIKQVRGKTCRIILSCNLAANAILFNLQPYWFISVLKPSNMCHTKQGACICSCKSWHTGKIKYLWKLKNQPETSIWNAEKFLRMEWEDGMGCLPYTNIQHRWELWFKAYEGELVVAKSRRLAQANICSWSTLLFRPRFPEEKSQ